MNNPAFVRKRRLWAATAAIVIVMLLGLVVALLRNPAPQSLVPQSLAQRTLNDLGLELGGFTFTPDGNLLTTNAVRSNSPEGWFHGELKFWDVRTGRFVKSITVEGTPTAITISPDGRMIAASVAPRDASRPWIIDASNGEVLTTFSAPHFRETRLLAFSPDSRLLAWTGNTSSVWVRSLNGQEVDRELKCTGTSHAMGIQFSPDGKTLAVAWLSIDPGSLQLWDTETWKLQRSADVGSSAFRLAFSGDGRILLTGGVNTMCIRDPQTGQAKKTWPVWEDGDEKRTRYVLRIATSRNGRLAVVATQGGWLKIWDTVTGDALITVKEQAFVGTMAFSPDDRTLATGDEKTVKLWDVQRITVGMPVRELLGLVKAADIPADIKTTLTKRLTEACDGFAAGAFPSGIRRLTEFRNAVSAASGKTLPADTAATWAGRATELITVAKGE